MQNTTSGQMKDNREVKARLS